MASIAPTSALLPTSGADASTELTADWTAVSNQGNGAANPDVGTTWSGVVGGGATSVAPAADALTGADNVETAWNGAALTNVVAGGGASTPTVVTAGSAWNTPTDVVTAAPDTVTDAWSSGIATKIGAGGYGAPVPDAPAGVSGGGGGAAGGVAATSDQAAANAELEPLLGVLAKTTTGSQIVAALRRTNIKIDLVPTSVFRQTHSVDTLAVFDSGTNTITLQRDQVLSDPARTALTFAHEATHALDDGRIDSSVAAADIESRSTTNPAAAFAQAEFEVHMTAEARAYRNEAQTAIELGLDPRTSIGLTPAVDPATGGIRDFATTWRAVAALRAYNPDGRTGTPSDFAT